MFSVLFLSYIKDIKHEAWQAVVNHETSGFLHRDSSLLGIIRWLFLTSLNCYKSYLLLDAKNECLQHCPASSNWAYSVGKIYNYNYLVSTSSTMKGTSDEESSVTFQARARIGVTSPCNFVLKVTLCDYWNRMLYLIFCSWIKWLWQKRQNLLMTQHLLRPYSKTLSTLVLRMEEWEMCVQQVRIHYGW